MVSAENARRKAKALLLNYFIAIAEKAGMRWDSDYSVEIEEAIDYIIVAAVTEARR